MPNLPKAVMGVDPGGTGCVAVITEFRQLAFVRLTQYERRLWLPALKPLFTNYQIIKVLQEKTNGRRGDFVNHVETFGRNTGSLETCLWFYLDRKMEIEYIQDQKWQRHQAVAGIGDRTKQMQVYAAKAQAKFKSVKVTQDMGAGILIADTAWDLIWGF